MANEFTTLEEGCLECGQERPCSDFNHVLLKHHEMKICQECYDKHYDDDETYFIIDNNGVYRVI